MIQIRSAQHESLNTATEASFLTRAVEHLREYDPARATTAGDEGLRQAAALALAKARKHGYVGENSVLLVLELMSAFGSSFETDPQVRWLSRLFLSADGSPEIERTHRLRWHSIASLDRIYGVRGEYGQDALARAVGLDMDALHRAVVEHASAPAGFLRWLHPTKYDFTGEPACRDVFLLAAPEAKAHGMGSAEGTFLTAGLMFTFGSGVFTDPLFARMRESFDVRPAGKQAASADTAQKVSSVLSQMHAYLAQLRARSSQRPSSI